LKSSIDYLEKQLPLILSRAYDIRRVLWLFQIAIISLFCCSFCVLLTEYSSYIWYAVVSTGVIGFSALAIGCLCAIQEVISSSAADNFEHQVGFSYNIRFNNQVRN
jgi:hypothetical protein